MDEIIEAKWWQAVLWGGFFMAIAGCIDISVLNIKSGIFSGIAIGGIAGLILYYLESDFFLTLNLFFFHSEGDLMNDIIKSVLIGICFGILIGLTGEFWNFKVNSTTYIIDFEYFGTAQAFLGGIIVSLSLFLKYNKKS